MKRKLLALIAALAIALGATDALALSVTMRPATGQPAPGTVTQSDSSVVSPDANGNFALTQSLTIIQMLAQGWVVTAPGNSVNALGNVVAGTVNMDLSKGCLITETLTGAITQTFSNVAFCKSQLVCVEPTQDATGGRAVTWSGFSGLTPPQPNQTLNKTDEICFADDGVNLWYPIIGQTPTYGSVGIAGSTSGLITIAPQAVAGTYNFNLPTTSGALGALLLSGGGGATAEAWLADVATGQVLTSGGVGANPAYSATPTLTSLTLSGTGDLVALLSNGGHLSSQKGTSTVPAISACGTGSIAASGTDTAGDVTATGATSCVVTFNTAFANKPVCTATDETSAVGLKIVYTGATAITVSGLTSGDEFTYICVGK